MPVNVDKPIQSIQDNQPADRAVEDSGVARRHERGVTEGDPAPTDLEVGSVDAEDFAGFERSGLARFERGSLVGLETDRVADVAALEVGKAVARTRDTTASHTAPAVTPRFTASMPASSPACTASSADAWRSVGSPITAVRATLEQ